MRKTAADCTLSRKQEVAILILLRPFHGTLRDVAKSVGVSLRTLQYWLKLQHFQERLKEGRAEVWGEALSNLTGSMSWASRFSREVLG